MGFAVRDLPFTFSPRTTPNHLKRESSEDDSPKHDSRDEVKKAERVHDVPEIGKVVHPVHVPLQGGEGQRGRVSRRETPTASGLPGGHALLPRPRPSRRGAARARGARKLLACLLSCRSCAVDKANRKGSRALTVPGGARAESGASRGEPGARAAHRAREASPTPSSQISALIANIFRHAAIQHLDKKRNFLFFFSFARCCFIHVTPTRTDVVTEASDRHLYTSVVTSWKEAHGVNTERAGKRVTRGGTASGQPLCDPVVGQG